ncbi:GGDEF domain-containing protein [Schlegelella sp. S2-27]|uniref:diguanylate cyclase n=1 Tax=Caldimonas mangrovi TaxID=2944811 RepID=A0ABT0YPX2_9BURK|nr:GGDEF domain-containing protein [Caldimonas mangrovi]MCM5680297.1 GGDEF domain-containing protein [Caldimonas mangrovi]
MEQPQNPVPPGSPAPAGDAADRTSTMPGAALLDALLGASEHAPVGIYVKDAQGRYVFVNPAAARLLGREAEQVLGRTDDELLSPEYAAILRTADQAALAQGRAVRRDDRIPDASGAVLELLAVRTPVPGGYICGTWTDPSELRRTQAQLRHALEQLEMQQRQNEELRQELKDQSVRDPLTGVYNRNHFEEQLRREVDLSMREHREFALVSVQVDDYAQLVARHGQPAGERVLQALGRLLRGNTRAMDAPCRLGEDRFAVVLSGVGLATAHSRMESVRRQCEAQIVMLEGEELRFTVSMGVASFPHTTQERQVLLDAAEAALLEARRRGSNCVMPAAIAFGQAAANPL